MGVFEFYCVGRIVFGRGESARLGAIAAGLGRRALVAHNWPQTAADRLARQLAGAGVHAELVVQNGEPKIGDVDAMVEHARRTACDLVIGAGGGSAVDAAKAVAGLLGNGGVATDYMEVVGRGQKITRPAIPWIAVPTTAGTGAEATRNAVIGHPEKKFKASIRSELLLPRVALVDPELGVDVPPAVTAASGLDALCQLIESYTSTGATPITDGLAMKGMELAAGALLRAYRDGHDIDAREAMAMAALLSGITLSNAGLGAVHGFAAPMGANWPIPHGAVCAILLPPVIAANVAAMRAAAPPHAGLKRYADVGRVLAGRRDLPDGEAIDLAERFPAELAAQMDLGRLGRFGFTPADIPATVELAKKASSMRFNPVKLSDDALAGILRAAL